MLTQKSYLFLLCFVLLGTTALSAQDMIDGFFKTKGELSLTASYSRGVFDEFYVGDTKVGPVPAHEEISQNIYTLYGAYGITDDLSVVVNVPYVSATGDGVADPVNGLLDVDGLQDVSAYLKYRPLSAGFSGGRFDVVTAAGVSVAGDYEPNGILSLGSGANSANFRVGGHLHLNSGLFLTATGGYDFRGEAENTGAETDFDVPNAFRGMAKVGYAGGKFYVEGWFDFQQTLEDDLGPIDIMGERFTGNFPETTVNYARVGASVYVPLGNTLGVSAGYGTVIDGRNLGDTNLFSAGLTVNLGGR